MEIDKCVRAKRSLEDELERVRLFELKTIECLIFYSSTIDFTRTSS